MSELYTQLLWLDPPIAIRWKQRTNDDPNRRLTAADIEAILGPLRTGKIGVAQGKAIVEIMQKPRASDEAVGALKKIMGEIEDIHLSGREVFQTKKLSGNELSQVCDALGLANTSRILFTSPKTNATYASFDYLAVAEGIKAGAPEVFTLNVDRLNILMTSAASYNSTGNKFYIHRTRNLKELAATIVHEATHVIQDFRQIEARRKYIEADAYIAEAIATYSFNNGQSLYEPTSIYGLAFSAAKYLIFFSDNREVYLAANSSNTREVETGRNMWARAYDKVVDAVTKAYADPEARAGQIESKEMVNTENKLWEVLTAEAHHNVIAPRPKPLTSPRFPPVRLTPPM